MQRNPLATDRHALDQTIVSELKMLSQGADHSFFREQVLLFSRRGRAHLGRCEDAWLRDDRALLAAGAHALAGSASVIGATYLSRLCVGLEDRLEIWDRERIGRAVEAIREAFEAAEDLLAQEARAVRSSGPHQGSGRQTSS
jgi:HPt (histidine-containing phosphotransfer) domain-containing protein